jgi:hypothetical protein
MLGFLFKFCDTFKSMAMPGNRNMGTAVVPSNNSGPSLGPGPSPMPIVPGGLPMPNPMPPMTLQQPPPKRRNSSVSNIPGRSPLPVNTPTPVASAVSPMPNAPSPRTPRSPKSKPKPKPKIASTSKVPTAGPAPVTPTPVPAAPETPQSGSKRSREEESTQATSSQSAPLVAPSPKRQKSDWNGPVSEEVIKREADFEAVKTTEDAVALLEQIQSSVPVKLEDPAEPAQFDVSLEQILKEFGGEAAFMDGLNVPTAMTASSSRSDTLRPASPSVLHSIDDFSAFIDLSSFGAAEETSTIPEVPELVPSSSANPSPESDVVANTPKMGNMVKSEPLDNSLHMKGDALRLGAWAEISPQAAYYQSDEGWNWSEPMPPAEWAILQS